MTGPAVAVVVPARNAEATLAAAVASALTQEVDGGLEVCIAVAPSLDQTAEVALGLAESDRRVSVVDNPGGAAAAGLNAAIRATTGPAPRTEPGAARSEPGDHRGTRRLLKRRPATGVLPSPHIDSPGALQSSHRSSHVSFVQDRVGV